MTPHERAYWLLGHGHGVPDAGALRQFREHQSRGVVPDDPNADYRVLSDGKRHFEILAATLRSQYLSDWPGWDALERDWQDDPWVLGLLCPWRA